MRRSILRHYIGNRDELVDALADKVISDYRQETESVFTNVTDKERTRYLIDLLLPATAMGTTQQLLIIEALIGAAGEFPKVRKLVFEYIDDYIQLVAKQLKQISPGRGRQTYWDVAYGLVCISFNHESLQPLALPSHYLRGARKIARSLIDSLNSES